MTFQYLSQIAPKSDRPEDLEKEFFEDKAQFWSSSFFEGLFAIRCLQLTKTFINHPCPSNQSDRQLLFFFSWCDWHIFLTWTWLLIDSSNASTHSLLSPNTGDIFFHQRSSSGRHLVERTWQTVQGSICRTFWTSRSGKTSRLACQGPASLKSSSWDVLS